MDKPILIDAFPFFFTVDDDYSDNVEIFSQGSWQGPVTEETEAARLKGLKDSWANDPARRQQASEQLKAARPNMPHSTPTLSATHKENIGKGMKGNQNKTGKKGGNQYTNPK